MRYYFNDHVDSNGYHEIHTQSCSFLPKPENRTYLGDFASATAALATARLAYRDKLFDGCYYCCNEIHRH